MVVFVEVFKVEFGIFLFCILRVFKYIKVFGFLNFIDIIREKMKGNVSIL